MLALPTGVHFLLPLRDHLLMSAAFQVRSDELLREVRFLPLRTFPVSYHSASLSRSGASC